MDIATVPKWHTLVTHQREIRADLLLIRNIRTLLQRRGLDQNDLAFWCGHKPPWISKILNEERGIKLDDVGRVADFFGLTVSQMFQYGISEERRRRNRRTGLDRRSGLERRKSV